MSLPKTVQKRISTLTKNFDKCMDKLERLDAAGRYGEYLTLRQGELATIYKDACVLLREADATNAAYRADLLDAVQPIIDEVIQLDKEVADIGCLTLRPQDYHDNPIVVKDQRIRNYSRSGREVPNKDSKPHPKSNPFANFGLTLAKRTATSVNRSAICVYDARCEIESVRDDVVSDDGWKRADMVCTMRVSSGGACMAVIGCVSTEVTNHWHCQREEESPAPWVAYHFPDDPQSKFSELMSDRIYTGLAEAPSHLTLAEDQRLIFVADDYRVKSFAWATANGSYRSLPLATHTLDSKGFQGPMAALPNGNFVRAGEGAVAIWDLKQLETHGTRGNKIIGEFKYIEDKCEYSSHFDYHLPEFEYSSGSPRTSKVRFTDDPELAPEEWQLLPHFPSTVLAAGHQNNERVAIDLEHRGKTITRYQGHSGYVTHVSVSAGDPHVFLTSAYGDDAIRIFDVRRPRAVLQFSSRRKGSPIALAHPDGTPTVFASSASDKDFVVWDVRSRACVYELKVNEYSDATLESLAWDSSHNTLFSLKSILEEPEEDSEYGHPDDDEYSIYNRIYRYAFKENPEYSILRADYPESEIDQEGSSGTDSDSEREDGSDEYYEY